MYHATNTATAAFRFTSFFENPFVSRVNRRRCILTVSEQAGTKVPFRGVFDFVRETFSHGEALAEYWEDCHAHRNMLLHPDSNYGAYVMHPMSADDIVELFDPMLSLYRYILIGEQLPSFGEAGFRAE